LSSKRLVRLADSKTRITLPDLAGPVARRGPVGFWFQPPGWLIGLEVEGHYAYFWIRVNRSFVGLWMHLQVLELDLLD